MKIIFSFPSVNEVTPSKLCSDHCKLIKLLEVCPHNLLRKVEARMEELGVSFLQPECDADKGDINCLPLQTSLSARPSAAIVGDDPAPMEGEFILCEQMFERGI